MNELTWNSIGTNLLMAEGTDGMVYLKFNPLKEYGETGGGNTAISTSSGGKQMLFETIQAPNVYIGLNVWKKTVFKKARTETK